MSLSTQQPTWNLCAIDTAVQQASWALLHLGDALWADQRGGHRAGADTAANICALDAATAGNVTHDCRYAADLAQAVEMILGPA